jgi:hypothetical protein
MIERSIALAGELADAESLALAHFMYRIGNEAQLHQLACGVVDEDQQRAGLAALLEPAMIAAVDLDQIAVALTPQSRLMEGSSLRTRQPYTSAIIQRRSVSRPTRSSCLSSRTSVASVGPKSVYLVLSNSTAYFRMPSFLLRLDVRLRA